MAQPRARAHSEKFSDLRSRLRRDWSARDGIFRVRRKSSVDLQRMGKNRNRERAWLTRAFEVDPMQPVRTDPDLNPVDGLHKIAGILARGLLRMREAAAAAEPACEPASDAYRVRN